jgi:hypothetical protein
MVARWGLLQVPVQARAQRQWQATAKAKRQRQRQRQRQMRGQGQWQGQGQKQRAAQSSELQKQTKEPQTLRQPPQHQKERLQEAEVRGERPVLLRLEAQAPAQWTHALWVGGSMRAVALCVRSPHTHARVW